VLAGLVQCPLCGRRLDTLGERPPGYRCRHSHASDPSLALGTAAAVQLGCARASPGTRRVPEEDAPLGVTEKVRRFVGC
jgi:hypothetical protein